MNSENRCSFGAIGRVFLAISPQVFIGHVSPSASPVREMDDGLPTCTIDHAAPMRAEVEPPARSRWALPAHVRAAPPLYALERAIATPPPPAAEDRCAPRESSVRSRRHDPGVIPPEPCPRHDLGVLVAQVGRLLRRKVVPAHPADRCERGGDARIAAFRAAALRANPSRLALAAPPLRRRRQHVDDRATEAATRVEQPRAHEARGVRCRARGSGGRAGALRPASA